MAGNFAAQVKAFADKAKLRQDAIFQSSANALMDEAGTPKAQGGKMPVDTGFLRNSAVASKDGMPNSGSSAYGLVFASLKAGETVYAGWTAAYASRMEYGFVGKDSLGRQYNQQGNGFARAAQQNWQFIVERATNDVEAAMP